MDTHSFDLQKYFFNHVFFLKINKFSMILSKLLEIIGQSPKNERENQVCT